MDKRCCELDVPHHHDHCQAPNGEWREVVFVHPACPNAEVRDPETGEVIFPAQKAPFRLVKGGLDQPNPQEVKPRAGEVG